MRSIPSPILGLCLLAVLAGCGGEEPGARRAGSELPAKEVAAARCPHGADPGVCFLCDASLRDPGRLWCREHARYEDRCWICHPDLRDPGRPYCDAHGLYEDECVLCGAAVDGPGQSGAPSVPSGDLFCSEHRVPERECGICQPTLADALRPGEGLKIRLASAEAADKAGIVARPIVRAARGAETVRAPGELAMNGDRLVHLTPLVEGVIREMRGELGAPARRGDRLVGLFSSAAAEAHAAHRRATAEAMEAERKYEREATLHEQGVCSAQELEEARARRASAVATREATVERLRELGFGNEDLARTTGTDAPSPLLYLRAPFDGTVVDRRGTVGDVAEAGRPILTLCDLDTLWLDLAVSEATAAHVAPGQAVSLTTAGSGITTTGVVTWVAHALDPVTRQVRVRAVVPNGDRRLRAGSWVEAEIALRAGEEAGMVDRDEVHRFGGHPFVFVQLEADLFEVRRVELGPERDGTVAIAAGLSAEDRVVSEQSYLLKSEFQKSRLGAGCVD